MSLRALGWSSWYEQAFIPFREQALIPARVGVQHRGGYEVWTRDEVLAAEVSGRFRHQARTPADYPAVGDWVAIELLSGESRAIIHVVLPRKTCFSRKAAGDTTEEQLIAANIDEVFVIESLAGPPNLRRIERFLTLAWESGARPTVVLTKSDLCPDPTALIQPVQSAAGRADVLIISCLAGEGVAAVRKHLRQGWTVAFLGPSGVGKSTLVNHLVGEEVQPVLPVRESDQKGRHTTTSREMVFLSGGGVLIDTPGLRELQLWEGEQGVESAFADVEALATGCRFTDCRHQNEPGCAVRLAVVQGRLTEGRLASFQKLRLEASQFGNRRAARARSEEHRRAKIGRSLRGQKLDEE